MKKFYKYIFVGITCLALSGCSSMFSVGKEKSYCAEFGCDYTDVGVCANPIEILENKDDLSGIKKRNQIAKEASHDFWENN